MLTGEGIAPRPEYPLPGEQLAAGKMPGHWLLARMGKRVLRPGGLELTGQMLDRLDLSRSDHVVEFAPGLGVTARITLSIDPASYTAVERDEAAAAQVRRWLTPCRPDRPRQVITGVAQDTGLPEGCATVVYGEAMLTMQTETRKRQIIREALRLLQPGGRYGIHELCLAPDDLPERQAEAIRRDITQAIHHQAVPLTGAEWETLLRQEGFEIVSRITAPMALLEPGRVIRDEGLLRAARFAWRMLWNGEARRRVKSMRAVFRRHRENMSAICFVVRKPMAEA